jgi:very-short-patch-repair endonuclease
MRQDENRQRFSAAEEWAWTELQKLKRFGSWSRQVVWGCRIFDFWCSELGIAVEIDGPEHQIEYDQARDRYNYWRSGIVVLRVPNFDAEVLEMAVRVIREAETKQERKARIRLSLGVPPNFPMKRVPELVGLRLAHGKWQPS